MRNPAYLGSMWNILVHWDDGTKDWQNLDILAAQVPDMCAQYAIDNRLLHKDGWKRFKRRARNKKKLLLNVKAAKKEIKRFTPVFQYGVEVPRDPRHARILDAENKNTKWQDAEYAEIQQLMEY